MVRMGAKLCPEAHSRSITSRRVNSTSQSGSGAVMMTSHTSSAGGGMLLLQLADKLSGLGFGPGHAAPSGDDVAVVAEPNPYDSEREPDGVLLKACGTRRESRCLSCAATYRADAYQLLAAGLKGGKGVPETIDQHPRLFVTFTAPASAASIPAKPRAGWCCPATRTARVPAAPTVCGMAAGIAMVRTTPGLVSRSVRPAITPRRRCSGTPLPPSCGDGPPSPSSVPSVGWSASRRGSCGGWCGSPMPRWPSSSGAGRSTSTPSYAWTRPPTAAAPAV